MSEMTPAPDTSWIQTERADRPSGYVVKPTGEAHRCPLPAEWITGAIWRCPDGHLWQVGPACPCRNQVPHPGQHTLGRAWWPVTSWRIRRRHRGRRPDLGMANSNRVQYAPRPSPPPGRGAGS
jgi:hypothetical protein